jgi:hypothetical protein
MEWIGSTTGEEETPNRNLKRRPLAASPYLSKAWATACAGAISGFTQVCAEQPFDTIKIRLQSRRFDKISSPAELVRRTYLTEGVGAFFLGIAPRLATYSAVKFSLFSLYERFLGLTQGNTFAAGAIAGGINSLVSCPQDVLKSQLQMQIISGAKPMRSSSGYRGPVWTITQLLKQHGAGIFYRGLAPLALRDTIGYGILYSTYFGMKEWYGGQIPTWVCGGVSGVMFYMITLPIDRCKTILMTQNFDREVARSTDNSSKVPTGNRQTAAFTPQQVAYSTGVKGVKAETMTSSQAFWGVFKSQGLQGFYRGCEPTLLRTFCGQAVALTTYDYALQTLYPPGKQDQVE